MAEVRRKMAAKMQDLGARVLYYENGEGGHAGAVNHRQIAYKTALEYMFLEKHLCNSQD
jgi:prolyl oligopeptidase